MCKKKGTGDELGESEGGKGSTYSLVCQYAFHRHLDPSSLVLAFFHLLGFKAAFWHVVFRSTAHTIFRRGLQDFSLKGKTSFSKTLLLKMHNLMLFTLAPLVIASDLSKRFALLPRQGNDAFIPGTAGVVYNCANPCGGDCIFPDEGDTCCVENCKLA